MEKIERTTVLRNAGHPWDRDIRPGFDLLFISVDNQSEMDALVEAAEKKFWQPWLIGFNEETGLPGGVMYKPCDIKADWHDSPDKPHPGCPRPLACTAANQDPENTPELVESSPARIRRPGP